MTTRKKYVVDYDLLLRFLQDNDQGGRHSYLTDSVHYIGYIGSIRKGDYPEDGDPHPTPSTRSTPPRPRPAGYQSGRGKVVNSGRKW